MSSKEWLGHHSLIAVDNPSYNANALMEGNSWAMFYLFHFFFQGQLYPLCCSPHVGLGTSLRLFSNVLTFPLLSGLCF